ncbi:MAG: hypothetical protein KDG55_05990 [Rhodocyclaceae bacterium]|nr:hypothetical protein [Rhodocyclaceae bacterium]
MSAGDDLAEIIASARRELPEISDDAWRKFEALVRAAYGTQKVYIAARRRSKLEELEAMQGVHDTAELARKLGVSVRRVNQLKRLTRR